jgi:hypothetical protein
MFGVGAMCMCDGGTGLLSVHGRKFLGLEMCRNTHPLKCEVKKSQSLILFGHNRQKLNS